MGLIKDRERKIMQTSAFTAIGHMASQVAHDMRSPLSVIKIYLDMNDSDVVSNEDKKELQEAAVSSTEKLNMLAGELVNFAKSRHVQKTTIFVESFFEEQVLPEIKSKADQKGIQLQVIVSEPVTALIDVFKMQRVLVNLVMNAIEAIQHDHGVVAIHVGVQDEMLIIRVSDNGVGIEEKDLSNIFDIFFTKGKKKGSGLGLAYCQQVVRGHEGNIEVQSTVGLGTVFSIVLPDAVVTENTERVLAESLALSFAGKKIFIADDESAVRWAWQIQIQKQGGEVVWAAETPEEVLSDQVFDYGQIDIALVDYVFEGSQHTGIEVVKHLKMKGVKEIHLCTGHYDNMEIRKRAFSSGVTGIRNKNI